MLSVTPAIQYALGAPLFFGIGDLVSALFGFAFLCEAFTARKGVGPVAALAAMVPLAWRLPS